MHRILYYIDPLFQETQAQPPGQPWLTAIPGLSAALPGYRHLALSFDPGTQMEAQSGLELLFLPLPRISFRSPQQDRNRTLRQWLQDPAHTLLVQFSAADWLSVPGARSLLFTSEADVQQAARQRQQAWQEASLILLPYEQDRLSLAEAYPQIAPRMATLFPALEEPVEALGWAGQEQVKLKYTNGRDYCLYAGPLSEEAGVIQALKAYSNFKKWLLTGMPMVLAGPHTADTDRLEKKLETYKYKADISLYADLEEEEWKNLVAGAYMMVCPAATGYAQPIAWAHSAGTPVVTVNDLRLREWVGTAAAWSEPGDLEQLAHSMMLLYKDENTRSQLIEKGREQAARQKRTDTIAALAGHIRALLEGNG